MSDMCVNAHKYTNIMCIVEDPLFKVLEVMTEFEPHCCLGATICLAKRMFQIMSNITCAGLLVEVLEAMEQQLNPLMAPNPYRCALVHHTCWVDQE